MSDATFAIVTNYEVIGLTGAGIYTLSYVLAAYDRLPSQSPFYYLCNLMAAAMVLISLTESFNLASTVIQIFFLSVSIVGICRHRSRSQRLRSYEASQHALGGDTIGGQQGNAYRGSRAADSDRPVRASAEAMPFLPGSQALTADRNWQRRSDFG